MKPEKLPGVTGLKAALRQQMRTALQVMTPEERAQASLEICHRAAKLPAFREAKTVAFFASLATEPDIQPLVEEAWAQGKRVVFPLMSREGDVARLDWRVTKAWEELVVVGPFGIREPDPARCPSLAPEELDCVFVPGLAFDLRGARLGRGGGYYDAALSAMDVGTSRIGLMFVRQRVDQVPHVEHDQVLTLTVSEREHPTFS